MPIEIGQRRSLLPYEEGDSIKPTEPESTESQKQSRSKNLYARLPVKRRGELAEAAFLHKAAGLGFSVANPWGDSDHYDFIVENGVHSWRVQIKSAYSRGPHNYCIRACGHNRVKYNSAEVDFLIAYIVPEEAWYVIPIRAFSRGGTITLTPASPRRKSRFEKYRDAWCLTACPQDGECRMEVELVRCCERDPATGKHRCPKDE